MAQAVDIVIADAQATPVGHTFKPLGPEGTWDMVFEDQSQASPVGFWRIYVRLKRNAGARVAGQNMRVDLSLQEPVLEAIAPAASGLTQPPTIAYTPRFDCTFAQRPLVSPEPQGSGEDGAAAAEQCANRGDGPRPREALLSSTRHGSTCRRRNRVVP